MTITPFNPWSITIAGRRITVARPWVMGIINATPDSFYAGSRTPAAEQVELRASQLAAQGADALDVGACSTRPGAAVVDEQEELRRLRVAVPAARRAAPGLPISVDTFRASVAQVAVEELGADIVNDISGGDLDSQMWHTVARLSTPYVVMHTRGTPATMQSLTDYDDVVADVAAALAEKCDRLKQAGVDDIIADPGFGFGKTVEQNYALLAHLDALAALDAPLLIGVSRKSMVTRVLDVAPDQALNGTTVLHTIALLQGASVLRVHDVGPAVEARALVEQLPDRQPLTR